MNKIMAQQPADSTCLEDKIETDIFKKSIIRIQKYEVHYSNDIE